MFEEQHNVVDRKTGHRGVVTEQSVHTVIVRLENYGYVQMTLEAAIRDLEGFIKKDIPTIK